MPPWYAWPVGLFEAWLAYCLTWRLPHGLGVLPNWIPLSGSACRKDPSACRTFPGAGYCTTHQPKPAPKPVIDHHTSGISMMHNTVNRLHRSGPFVQAASLWDQIQTTTDLLFGAVSAGVVTPSEARDLGWWFKLCEHCGSQLACTPDHPEPGCRCEKDRRMKEAQAHEQAIETWRNMNVVPPHAIGVEFGPVLRHTPHLDADGTLVL